jgi:hypothetical protein
MYFPLGAHGSYEIGWATPVNKNLRNSIERKGILQNHNNFKKLHFETLCLK